MNNKPVPGKLITAVHSTWNASSDINWIVGRLGVRSSSGVVVDVVGRAGIVYVSLGSDGTLGQATASDAVGVDHTVEWQLVKMRRENGVLVIREAESYAAGGSGGSSGSGGSGATNLDELTDVTITTPASGQVLSYDGSQWVNTTGGGGGMAAHDLSGAYHTGLLNWTLLSKSGSSLADIATRPHSALTGIGPNDHHSQQHAIVSSDHTASGLAVGQTLRATSPTTFAWQQLQHTDLGTILPDQHHNQQHLIVGPDHTASGLVAGYTIRAYNPTSFQWDQLQHDDLGGITADQHHRRAHDIITGDLFGSVHTIVGAKWQIVGAAAVNTLGLLTPVPNPGANEAILRTDVNGGIQLDTNVLYVDGANNWVGFNRTPNGAAVDIQAAAAAQISQRIKQISGQTGRLWRIEDTSGQELIVLDSVGNLQSGSPGFVSSLTGWQVTPQGNAEFNNIWARGELHATVFVKDEIHASGGSLLVATAGVLHDDAVIDSGTADLDTLAFISSAAGYMVPWQVQTTSATFVGTTLSVQTIGNFINVNDPPSGPALYFQPNEILRVKTEIPSGVSDLWLEVISATQLSGYSKYSVTKRSGTDATIPKGAAVVSYGLRGQGRILLTSDWRNDTEKPLSPYIDVFTTGQNPWAGGVGDIVPRVRMGQLAGVGVSGVSGISQWGLIASDDLSNTNAGYIIASNLGVRLYKVPLILNDGSVNTGSWLADGNLRVGKNVDADATTGFRVITTGASAGDVIIGDVATPGKHYIRWNQAAGTLTVFGNLQISGDSGSAYATVGYVDGRDNATLTSAQNYANTVGSNSNTYGNARRVVKVAGTGSTAMVWTSGGNLIGWSGVYVYFADGTNKALSDNYAPGYSIVGRIYLYVDVTQAAPLTPIYQAEGNLITNPNWVLIAVLTPGVPNASVTIVASTTYISGGNIWANSITVNNMAADSIWANQIKAGEVHASHLNTDVVTSFGNSRGLAVEGRFVPNATLGYAVSWSGIRVKKAAGGAPVSVQDSGGYSLTFAREYFYILSTDISGQAMRITGDISTIPADAILIAVVDTGPTKATVVMVNGGLLISGDNIVANSITAGQIAVGAVTADKINVNSTIAIAAGGAISGGGKTYGAGTGFFLGQSGGAGNYQFDIGSSTNYLRWSGTALTILGTIGGATGGLTVNGGIIVNNSAGCYIYSAGKTSFNNTTAGFFLGWDTTLGVNAYKFAVGDGTNYIQYNGIDLTIAGRTSALAVSGGINVGNGGAIFSSSKPTYETTAAGFFLGWHPSTFTYRLNIGDANHYIQWDSAQLNIAATGLFLNNATGNDLLQLSSGSYFVNFDVGASVLYSGALAALKIVHPIEVHDANNNLYVRATKLINAGNTMQIETPRTIAHFGDTPLIAGEICWDANFLYVCVGASGWRRIAWTSSSW